MLHQTFLFLGQFWQLFEVSQILEFLRYLFILICFDSIDNNVYLTKIKPFIMVNSYTFRKNNSSIFIFSSFLHGVSILKSSLLEWLNPPGNPESYSPLQKWWRNKVKYQFTFNPIALRKAKIVYNFGLSECNRVKETLPNNYSKHTIMNVKLTKPITIFLWLLDFLPSKTIPNI